MPAPLDGMPQEHQTKERCAENIMMEKEDSSIHQPATLNGEQVLNNNTMAHFVHHKG
jgi:hypothetical protein